MYNYDLLGYDISICIFVVCNVHPFRVWALAAHLLPVTVIEAYAIDLAIDGCQPRLM